MKLYIAPLVALYVTSLAALYAVDTPIALLMTHARAMCRQGCGQRTDVRVQNSTSQAPWHAL